MSTLPAYRQPKTPFGPSPGRPCILTQEIQDTLCRYLSEGAYLKTACQAAGVSHDAVADWIKRGDLGEERFVRFGEALQRAQAENEHTLSGVVQEVAISGKNWLAAMTYLERRHPERWARQDRLQIEQRSVQELTITVQFALPPGLEHSQGQVVAGPPAIDGEIRELGPGEAGPDTPVG